MNSFRKSITKKAFDKLDRDGSGLIEVDDIRGVYNAKNHPEVMAGRKTEDEILAEFLDTFEYHFTLLVRTYNFNLYLWIRQETNYIYVQGNIYCDLSAHGFGSKARIGIYILS